MSNKPLVTVIPMVLAMISAFMAPMGAWADQTSHGQTAATSLCIDTANPRITRLCANVVLRYKIDALFDVPMSTYGLTWVPINWSITQPDGSIKAVAHDHLPPSIARALSAVTMQLKGTAMVDFSASSPLQFLQYQTNNANMQDKTSWAGASRAPVDKWLFSPGQCQDGNRQVMDPTKAMALYKLGVKSLSIDPRSSASVCKTGTTVSNLDAAVKALDRFCHTDPVSVTGLCGSRDMAAAAPPPTPSPIERWATMLDDGIVPVLSRPIVSLLDDTPLAPMAVTSAEQFAP